MFNFIKNLGPTELIIIGVILIVFFGAKRIAGLGKTAGETTKEVKKIKKELTGTLEEVKRDDDKEVER
jgi:sec-independent protein translocase protein TatA